MSRFSVPNDVIHLIEILKIFKYEGYIVGGCVRDMLLGVKPHDWDICTNANPEQVINILKKSDIKFHTVGIEFGTVTALLNNNEYEITTYRTETGYTDGRHPDAVAYVANIHEDLKRRDFTINAMAYDPIDSILIDDFNGQEDLKNKIIKSVGNPADRFDEDSLRIVRALRFAIRLKFNIDRETSLCMHRQRGLLVNISKERITSELEKILTCGNNVRTYFLEYKDIIGTIIPEIIPCFYFNQNNKYHPHDVYEHILYVVDGCKTTKFEIKLAALLHDIGKPKAYVTDDKGGGHFYGHPEDSWEISKEIFKHDLKLTNEQSDRVLELVRYHDIAIANTKASVKRAMNKYGVDMLNDWFILKQADMDDHVYENCKCDWYMNIPDLKSMMAQIIDEQSCFSLKDLAINGNVIMQILDIKPGKQVGEILKALLEEVIDEKIVNDAEALKSRALELYTI